MNKGIVLYQSKYGAAKKYAQWAAEALSFDLAQVKGTSVRQVSDCDTIVLCGGIYASGIAGLPFFRKNIDKLQGKKLAIFCTGASPFDRESLDQIRARNLTGPLQDIPLFYGRGAWDQEAMTFADRTLCGMLQKAVAKKDPSTYAPWEAALMEAQGKKCDWTDRSYLEPLLDFLH